ncbi:MAG: hypothetical protein FWG50_11020 [Kiritimatiellaeota bacterium]|nr:hypothetical protein [Kiritimatiellota bacterium]
MTHVPGTQGFRPAFMPGAQGFRPAFMPEAQGFRPAFITWQGGSPALPAPTRRLWRSNMRKDRHMKFKPCFIAPLCLLASAMTAAEQPARDYTMVDLGNGLTTKLLDVGTTSMTIYVEWPLDMEFEEGWFHLLGKLEIEERGWHALTFLEFDSTQGKTTFEVPYRQLSWYYPEDETNACKGFEKKAFYAVRMVIPPDNPEGPFRGKYEEDDETDVQEGWWLREGNPPTVATTNAEVSLSSRRGKQLGVKDEESGIGGEESGMEGERPREPNAPVRRWLYLAILPLALAALYFLRRRKG